MLSKSQARWFFIIFTAGFSLVFLGLTVDTVNSVPERSHQDKLSEEVVRGKIIWEDNNCMGCHTILGEGAYYAPELTKVYERRGPAWMRTFLKDPQAMFPGERKMVQYNFTEEEITSLIAFFEWIGNINTNGFPAKPDLVATPPTNAQVADGPNPHEGSPEIFRTICVSCHAVGGKGGNVGPALDGVAKRYSVDELDKWLADPQAVKPGTAMPNLGLSVETRRELTTWLMTK